MRYLYKCRITCHEDSYTLNCTPLNAKGQKNKSIVFRGSEEGFKLFLRRVKAKDTQTSPASVKKHTYQFMIDTAKNGTDPYVYIWNYMLPKEGVIREKNEFLESNMKAKNYIEKLSSLGVNLHESTIEYNLKRAKLIPKGNLSLTGEVEEFFNENGANTIADFLVFLWKKVFKDFSKNIGLLIEFSYLSPDSYMVVADFDDSGKISKVFMSISTRADNISDVLQNIAHEFLHIDQYLSNELRKKGDTIVYMGKSYPYSFSLHEWEVFDMQHEKDVYAEEEKIVDLYREDMSDFVFENKEFKDKILNEFLNLKILKEVMF